MDRNSPSAAFANPIGRSLPNYLLPPALPRLLTVPADDPWRVFRFLRQRQEELDRQRAPDAPVWGRVAAVIATAEHAARVG